MKKPKTLQIQATSDATITQDILRAAYTGRSACLPHIQDMPIAEMRKQILEMLATGNLNADQVAEVVSAIVLSITCLGKAVSIQRALKWPAKQQRSGKK